MVNRFLACWLCAFAFTATARADEDVSGDWRIQSLIGVASAHWRAVPDCPDGIVVTAAPLAPGLVMQALEPGCNVWITQAFWDEDPPLWRLCTFFVHEYGHLLGHTHQDADPVMQAQEPPECTAVFRQAFPPRVKRRRWHWPSSLPTRP